MINEIRKSVKLKRPLIHCITNPISINQCANAVLAVGARPIMAEHPKEVEEITATAQALVINLGNITDVRMKSILLSAKRAKKENVPIVIDLVGVACSGLRRRFALRLVNKINPTVIKGNYSEIKAFYNYTYKSVGVHSENIDVKYIQNIAIKLAKKYSTIVLASGMSDVITDAEKTFLVKNGTHQLTDITGTGCMLGVLCGCYISVSPNIYGVLTACAVLGISGEFAKFNGGNGSFMINLIDKLSILRDTDVDDNINLEEC